MDVGGLGARGLVDLGIECLRGTVVLGMDSLSGGGAEGLDPRVLTHEDQRGLTGWKQKAYHPPSSPSLLSPLPSSC